MNKATHPVREEKEITEAPQIFRHKSILPALKALTDPYRSLKSCIYRQKLSGIRCKLDHH